MTNATQQTAARKRRQSTTDNSSNTITKEQWAQIAEELKSYFCHVEFKYQDTVITVTRERDGESKTVLSVYFDGTMRSGWGMETSEIYNPITRLFWCEKKKTPLSSEASGTNRKGIRKAQSQRIFPQAI